MSITQTCNPSLIKDFQIKEKKFDELYKESKTRTFSSLEWKLLIITLETKAYLQSMLLGGFAFFVQPKIIIFTKKFLQMHFQNFIQFSRLVRTSLVFQWAWFIKKMRLWSSNLKVEILVRFYQELCVVALPLHLLYDTLEQKRKKEKNFFFTK